MLPFLSKRNRTYHHQTTNNSQSLNLSHTLNLTASTVPIQLYPSEVVFRDVITNHLYQMNVYVKNLSKKANRIRVVQPANSNIEINYKLGTQLAAGLSLKLVVVFSTKGQEDVHSSMKIISINQNYDIQVPIHAYMPRAQILYEPFINLGFAKIGKTKTQEVYFRNDGKVPGEFILSIPQQNNGLSIQPNSFYIQPNEFKTALLSYKSSAIGIFRGTIEVQPCNPLLPFIQVTATSLEFSKFLINNEGKQISQIIFQTMYIGQNTHVFTKLVNNTPKMVTWRAAFKKIGQMNQFMTPAEVSKQQIQRLVFCEPTFGKLPAYSHQQITFKWKGQLTKQSLQNFQSVISEKKGQQVSSQQIRNVYLIDHKYNGLFYFNQQHQQEILKVQIQGKCMIPLVGVSRSIFKFGQCPVNQHRQICFTITNYSQVLPLEIVFPNYIHFTLRPKCKLIGPSCTQNFILSYVPKAIGKIEEKLQIKFATNFSYDIRVFAQCNGFRQRNQKKRGPQSILQDFIEQCTFVDDTTKRYDSLPKIQLSIIHSEKPQKLQKTLLHKYKSTEKPIELLKKQKSNQVLSNFRKIRVAKIKRHKIQQKWNQAQLKYKSQKLQSQLSQQNPVDIEFQTGLAQTFIRQQKIKLPQSNQPIRKQSKRNFQVHTFSSQTPIKQNIISRHINPQRFTSLELNSQQLSQIDVGPKIIDCGKVFIYSECIKYFHVRNRNIQPISIRLLTESEAIKGSGPKKQTLLHNSESGFKICYQPQKIEHFQLKIKYLINNIHPFMFQFKGQCIPVTLQLSKQQQKLSFLDDQKLIIKNNGNSIAQYKWNFTKDKIFRIEPQKGTVNPYSQIMSQIIYQPSAPLKDTINNSIKTQTQKLRLRILNGTDLTLNCIGQTYQSKLLIKPLQINFKSISVYKKFQLKIFIKNVMRNSTVIQATLFTNEQWLKINTNLIKLNGQQTVQIPIQIYSQVQKQINNKIIIKSKAGKIIEVPITGKIILPVVYTVQQQIDFEQVTTLGNYGQQIIHIRNQSPIQVQIGKAHIQNQFLEQCCICTQIIVPDQYQENMISKDNTMILRNGNVVRICQESTMKFIVRFRPENAIRYQFYLPLRLANCPNTILIPDLQRQVFCQGIRPKLAAQPSIIDFKRVIISNQQSTVKLLPISLSNPGQSTLQWKIFLNQKQFSPFSINTKQGQILPQDTITILVSFKPFKKGVYQKTIPISLLNTQYNQVGPYISLKVQGISDYPSITFDRRQIIMPTVPLGIQSRCIFKINNDGYDHLNVKHIIQQQQSNINIKLQFPNGNSLGITRKSQQVEAVFISKKSISFTLNVIFMDDANRSFVIPISGTSDNSLLILPSKQHNQCQYLQRYLNTTYLVNSPLHSFPQSFSDSEGQTLIQLLSCFNKEFKRVKLVNVKKNKVIMLQNLYCDLIRKLKIQGALLNHIRPQHLLQYNDYLQWLKSQQQSYIYQNSYCPQQYTKLYQQSWKILIYQILNIYVISRVCKNQKISSQQFLLNWIYNIYKKQVDAPQEKYIDKFQNIDSEYIAICIQYYSHKECRGIETKGRLYRIVEALSYIGLNSHIQQTDLENPSPKAMLLFIHQLYNLLPNYLPRQPPIIFNCYLGQSQVKSIQITNPTKRSISYWAKIQGSKDFTLQSQDSFQIESKKTNIFRVRFTSKVSQESNATLTFTSKRDSNYMAAALVFKLKSFILGRISQKIWNISGPLYEVSDFNISIQNQLKADGQFTIKIQEISQQKSMKQSKVFIKQSQTLTQSQTSLITRSNKIKIKKQSAENLLIIFCPTLPVTTKWNIIFSDRVVGQFQHTIVSQVGLPLINNQVIKTSPIYVDMATTLEIQIPLKNQQLQKLKKYLQNFSKRRQEWKNLTVSSRRLNCQQVYQLQSSAYQISVPNSITMIPNMSQHQQQKVQQTKKIPIKVLFKQPVKDFYAILTMKSINKIDIRRYKVLFTAIMKPYKAGIQIKCPLRQEVIQNIPIINSIEKDSTLKIFLIQQKHPQFFYIPQQKQYILHKSLQLPLTFKPKIMKPVQAKLVINNISTGQIIQYELKGIPEQPLPAGYITVEGNAGKLIKQINFPFQKYRIQIQFQGFSKQKTWHTQHPYKLQITQNFIKKVKGEITVIDQQGKSLWYVLEVDTLQTKPKKIVKLQARQREAVVYFVQIQSNKTENRDYIIQIAGSQIIKQRINIQTIHKSLFKVWYYPLIKGQAQAKITFKNQIQEFYYLFQLICKQGLPIRIPQFHTSLGSIDTNQIVFTNPFNQVHKFRIQSTNNLNYQITPDGNIQLDQGQTVKIKLNYTPSSMQFQNAQIYIKSQGMGNIKYLAFGNGILPKQKSTTYIQTHIKKQRTQFILFKNPFRFPISLRPSISQTSQFQLILKQSKILLGALQSVSIPIYFLPLAMKEYSCKVNLYMNQEIGWTYPIKGIVDNILQKVRFIKCKCRQNKVQSWQIGLTDFEQNKKRQFSFQLKKFPQKVLKYITISNQKNILQDNSQKLICNFRFLFYKPAKMNGQLEIQSQQGCRWIQKINLEISQPQPDDTIVIEAQLNTTKTVSFKITNKFKVETKFAAYLTAQSDTQFNCFPKQGNLCPFGSQGTTIFVTFSPNQYHKKRIGKLIVQTQQMFWSYIIKGFLPKYIPP